MKFYTTQNFELTLEAFNKKLGIRKDIDIDYHKKNSWIKWVAYISDDKEGINSILPDIVDYNIEIHYSINKSDLSSKEIQHLLSLNLGEFYPATETQSYIEGKLIFGSITKHYLCDCLMEYDGEKLKVEEVIVNFDDYKIEVL